MALPDRRENDAVIEIAMLLCDRYRMRVQPTSYQRLLMVMAGYHRFRRRREHIPVRQTNQAGIPQVACL